MPVGEIHIYTDGACSKGIGGFCALLTIDRGRPPGDTLDLTKVNAIMGHCTETTSNREELKAVIAGLSTLKRPADVHLYSDSKYALDGITAWIDTWKANGWRTSRKELVKNKDLWVQLDDARQPHMIHWHHVAGHQTGPNLDEHARWNGLADELAVQERLIAARELEAIHES